MLSGPMWKMQSKRSAGYLQFVATKPCAACGHPGPSTAHHMRCLGAGGMAIKPSDFHTIPLCNDCHDKEHRSPFLMDILPVIFRKALDILADYIQLLEEKRHGRKFLSQERGHQGSG